MIAVVPAEPDYHQVADDLRVEQQSGGDVGDRSDGENVERLPGLALFAGELHDAARGRGVDRGAAVRQIAGRTAEGESLRRMVEQGENPADLLEALLHAVGRTGGAGVQERGRRHGPEPEGFRRQQRVGERELVVHLVEGVGVEYRVDEFRRQVEPGPAQSRIKCGEGNGVHSWFPHAAARCHPLRRRPPAAVSG